MWQIMRFAVAFHGWRERDGDAGRSCPPAEVLVRERGGSCWEGAAEGCFAAGDGLSAAADPHQPAGTWALVSQQSGRRCQVFWQWPLGRSASSCPGHILVPLVMSVAELGCVESGTAVSASVLLPPCLHQGWGCGSLGVPSLLVLGWVFHTEGAGGQEWSTLIDILGAKCPWPWIFGCYLEFCAGKPPPHCCAPSRARWELLTHQGGGQRSRSRVTEPPPALHRDGSQAVFSGCAA